MFTRIKIFLVSIIALLVGVGCGSGGSIPTVSITTPPSGSSVTLGETVEVQASATDTDGDGIARIDLQVDGSVVQTSEAPGGAQASYSALLAWTPAVSAPVTLSVVAYRADGTASDPASITLNILNEDGSMDEPAVEEEADPESSEPDADSGGTGGTGNNAGGGSGSSGGGDASSGGTTDDSGSTDNTGGDTSQQDTGSDETSQQDTTDGSTTDDSGSTDSDQSSQPTSTPTPTPLADGSTTDEESDTTDGSSSSQSTATPTPSYTPTTEPAPQLAPEDARFNNPLAIPLDNTVSSLDFVSYPDGDTQDMVRYEVTGMNNNVALTGGRARLVISATCFGENTEEISFFTGGQTYACGQTLVDREVTADSDTGSITITAMGGSGTYVQWVLTGTATRVN